MMQGRINKQQQYNEKNTTIFPCNCIQYSNILCYIVDK